MMKERNIFTLTFIVVTLFYLGTRWYIFLGFNGTDDLHYAMLSCRILNRTYSPFVPNDIFCGRIILIALQSFIYRLAGISVLTTQIGTLLATILSCYLTVFKIIKPLTYPHVLLASSLFYFNPSLSVSTLGILPDAYVMLVGIFIVLATKKIILNNNDKKPLIKAFLIGLVIGISLLIKEISILFLFFIPAIILLYKPRQSFQKIVLLTFGFVLIVIVIGLCYYFYTGDFLFKVAQINNSDYRNSIHQNFDFKNWVIRLTYGPWKIFIVRGFYPLVLAAFILILLLITKGWNYIKNNYNLSSFLILLLLTLYFPFSLQEIKPLYIDDRHFIFLLPLAVAICSEYLYFYLSKIPTNKIMSLLFLCLLIICVCSTGNKWQWMIYGLMTILLIFESYLQFNIKISILLTCSILWLSTLEHAFFQNYSWFKDMQSINKNISGNSFYFIDNDNMMHWELLHKFDTSNYYYNIERKPFFMFSPYASKLNDSVFNPGWLIINKVYLPPSSNFQNTLNELKKTNAFKKQISNKYIEALYFDDSVTLHDLIEKVD